MRNSNTTTFNNVVREAMDLSDEKESTTEKLKKTFSIKIHGPKNPFKTKNPYKKDEE